MNFQQPDAGDIHRSAKRFIFSNLGPPERSVDLATGQRWELKGTHRMQSVFCLQGIVWVTQECDVRDYVLAAGEAFLVTLPGMVLVQALRPARIGYTQSLMPVPFKGRFTPHRFYL